MDIKYGRKRSGIKRELTAKINEWLESITDMSTQEAAAKDVIVTGGSICSMAMGDPINDFDLYFRTKETTIKVAKYYVEQFNKSHKLTTAAGVEEYAPFVRTEVIKNCCGVEEDRVVIFLKSAGAAGEDQDEYNYFETMGEDAASQFVESTLEREADPKDEKPRYRPVFMSQNAITLSQKIQLVIRFFGKPTEIHNNYDFVHATCYWDHAAKDLVMPAEALELMMSRTLVYRGSLYPIASIFRMKKFVGERGWRITAGQQLKIMWQISELNLQDYSVLREQLTGVDMAYMYQLIEALKGIDMTKVDSAYICEIIDRIFD